MNELLQKLVEAMPPPESPNAPDVDWEQVETNLGTALPDDYKAFVETYGKGAIFQYVWVWTQYGLPGDVSMKEHVLPFFERTFGYHRKHGMQVPYPLYPEPGGLLPFF